MTIARVLLVGLLLTVSAEGQTVDPGSTIWRVDGTTLSTASIAVSDLADGTDGELITWDAAGAPATVAVGTAAQVLTSNGAGTAPTFQAAAGGTPTQIVAGDSDMTVADAGAGTITATVDASAIGVWDVGGLTIGTADATDQIILPSESDAVTPTLAFGDGDSGFYENSDDVIYVAHATSKKWQFHTSLFGSITARAGQIQQAASSATDPAFHFGNDSDTGMGSAGLDQLSLIAGAVEAYNITETATVPTHTVNGKSGSNGESITLGSGVTTFALTTNFVTLTGDGAANTVATITGGVSGQVLRILFVDALVTITDTDAHTADTVDLNAAFTSADDTVMTLLYDGTSWYEAAPRSVN